MPISLLPAHFFFISILLSEIICIKSFTQAHRQCLDDQKTLLLELKNELRFNSSLSTKLVQWNQTTDDCCSWKGVECDGAGHVIGLQLENETISGGIDENSSSLFRLRYLKKLNLAWNDFNGTQIPRGIGNLTYLTHLRLSYAVFGGKVPIQLSLLRRLVSLHLSNFQLKLEHPNLKMLLQNLAGLRELYLDGVDFIDQKGEWYQIISSSLPDLRNLSLDDCSLPNPPDPYLSQFRFLTILRLDQNNLSTVVPDFFANFSSLTKLSLMNCSLKGSLGLSNNSSTGLQSSMLFRGLSNLIYLNLGHNSLSGSIPGSLFGLPSLEFLFLGYNQFSGRVNEFFFPNFSNIRYLNLWNNRLEGLIPESFFQLERLEYLYLSHNFFSGTFQLEEKIQRLPNLTTLDLSYNNLSVDACSTNSSSSTFPSLYRLGLASCNLYYFPDFIKQSSTLRYLDLSNNRIAGKIPSWIWEIGNRTLYYLNLSSNFLVDLQKPYNFSSYLGLLDLHSNQLQGELPLPSQASYIDYSNNNFDKPIPLNIGNYTTSLCFISLANNSLIGSVPASLCNATNLSILNLSENKLSGNIPPCLIENTDNLQVFNLGRNNINGDIPDKFSVDCSLQTLDLNHNNLRGNIPKSLRNCKSLQFMNVGNNNINDSFPCMLSSSLHVLILSSNRFHGEVRCHNSWPNLQVINIASNNFSGNLHLINFSSWRGMMPNSSDALLRRNILGTETLISDNYYQDEVTLTIKGLELKLVKIWPDFTSIDFSFNNFQGTIPNAIGNLSSLYLLNLSHNALTGTIPKSIGKLRQLGSLDLSANHLTGVIPMELAGTTFLQVLNLSNNKLVGEIPMGPQFQTFSADSFEGNTGLCGLPLNISCINTHGQNDLSPPKLSNVQSHGKIEIEWGYVSAVLGYVVGLGLFFWSLLFFQNWREIYFEKVDEFLDKIFDIKHRRRRNGGRRRVAVRNQVR